MLSATELDRVYAEVCGKKNGDEDHDRAFEAFKFEEIVFKMQYWCDNESYVEQKHIMIPHGTTITQAKDQPEGKEFAMTM